MLYIDQLTGGSIVVGAAPSPAARATTIITTTEDGAQEFNITGALTGNWLDDNGFFDFMNQEWTKSIISIDIGTGVTELDIEVLKNCSTLETLIIPGTVESIYAEACSNCTNLTSVVIGEGTTMIGGSAFEGCTNLETFTIPNSMYNILDGAFYNCPNLYDTSTIQGLKLVDGWVIGYNESIP